MLYKRKLTVYVIIHSYYLFRLSNLKSECSLVLRLGRLPSVPVDWTEVNTAWGQTVLLLYSLCRKISLNLNKYQLVPYGNFSYVKVKKLRYPCIFDY